MRDPLRAVVISALLATPAHAAEKIKPAVVAVSSTVANAKIPPEYLVDHSLATAWNSRTNDLVGAWIAVRVPEGARVQELQMTAGYTHVDNKLGDLFTKNPRIKKIRVTHNGKRVGDFTLDITNRGMQSVAMDVTGGELLVSVLEIEAGTEKKWKEACVSELVLWGVPGPAPAPARTIVRVGSLDEPSALSKAECQKVFGPFSDPVVGSEEYAMNETMSFCRVDTKSDNTITITLGLANTRRKAKVGAPIEITIESGPVTSEFEQGFREDRVDISGYTLTESEWALLVEHDEVHNGILNVDRKKVATLYRATAKGLVDILSYEETESGSDGYGSDTKCELLEAPASATLPKTLVVQCQRWDKYDPSAKKKDTYKKTRVTKRWSGAAYK